ncbi:MAG: hypothetical protein JW976_00205 [Syntrophaceae bacterium]|nr:hypothetical protein [Syntrophaceae bacterium]
MANRNQTSFAAELFVAAELTKQGHIVTITFGNEKAIDILAAKAGDPRKTVSIDVKGLMNPAPWALGDYTNKRKHPDIYVFCYLNKVNERPEYFIVPKRKVERLVGYAKNKKSGWISFKDVKDYKDKWDLIWQNKKHIHHLKGCKR